MKLFFFLALFLVGCFSTEPTPSGVLLKHEGYFFYLEESPSSLFMQGRYWDRDLWAWVTTEDTLKLEGGRESDWWKSGKFSMGITGNEPWYSRDGGECWHTWTSSEEGYPCVKGELIKGDK